LSNIDVQLTVGGVIAGRVTDEDSNPLAGIEVIAWNYNDSEQVWRWIESTSTDAEGNYQIKPLGSGIYILEFQDTTHHRYVGEYSGDTNSRETASDVIVVDGQTTEINASLAVGGQIMGVVTDNLVGVEGLSVDVYAYDPITGDKRSVAEASTGVGGLYTVGGIPAGNHRIRFAGDSYQTDRGYVTAYYPDAANINLATDIAVAAGEIITGINVDLTHSAEIEGQILIDQPHLSRCLLIEPYRYNQASDSWEEVDRKWRYNNFNGYFEAGEGLGIGTYRFEIRDKSGTYADAISEPIIISSIGEKIEGIEIAMQENTPTPVPTQTPLPTPSPTETQVPTNTAIPPTHTPVPTDTAVPPTETPVPTSTAVPPTHTPVPTDTVMPTHTIAPTDTVVPPTNTATPTATIVPPTETPIPTSTPFPPTNTLVPTNTSAPPTETLTPEPDNIDGAASLISNVHTNMGEVNLGEAASWTVVITNTGAVSSQNLSLTVELPANTELASDSEEMAWNCEDDTARSQPANALATPCQLEIGIINAGTSFSTILALMITETFDESTIPEPSIQLRSAASPDGIDISIGAGNNIAIAAPTDVEDKLEPSGYNIYFPMIAR